MELINADYNGYLITTDKSLMQPEAIHKWLSEHSYWAPNIPYETVKTCFDHSYCIGIIKDGAQVGYGRLVTDFAVSAYLADVYVVEEHQGKGLGKKMMQLLFDSPWTKTLRRITLATRDAQGLYAQYGFTPIAHPERLMEIVRTAEEIYKTSPGPSEGGEM